MSTADAPTGCPATTSAGEHTGEDYVSVIGRHGWAANGGLISGGPRCVLTAFERPAEGFRACAEGFGVVVRVRDDRFARSRHRAWVTARGLGVGVRLDSSRDWTPLAGP